MEIKEIINKLNEIAILEFVAHWDKPRSFRIADDLVGEPMYAKKAKQLETELQKPNVGETAKVSVTGTLNIYKQVGENEYVLLRNINAPFLKKLPRDYIMGYPVSKRVKNEILNKWNSETTKNK